MGTTTALRHLLRSLCHNTPWKYAVFWKLKHRSRMLLTWEDGYCEYPRPRDIMENMPDDKCFNDRTGIISFGSEIDSSNGSSVGYPIALAVANMSCLLYSLGEGIVGKVAFTGKHCWVFSEDVSAGEFNSKLMPEYLDEWKLQFAAGIKTILLVPVVPHGVVQLGSLEMVTEDLTLVACIKDLFNSLQNDTRASTPFTSNRDPFSPPSLFTLHHLKDFTASSDINDNQLNQTQSKPSMKKDPWVIDAVQITKDKMSTSSPYPSPLFIVQDNLQVSQKDLQYLLGIEEGHHMDDVREAMHGSLSVNPTELPYVQNLLMTADHLETNEGNLSSFFGLEEELDVPIQCNAIKRGSFENGPSMHSSEKNLEFRSVQKMNTNSADGFDFRYIGNMMDQRLSNLASEETGHKTLSTFSSFPFDSELHKALRPVEDELYDCVLYPALSGEDACSSSSLIYQTDMTEGTIEPLIGESNGWFMEEGNAEDLLDAIIANIYGASDENVCKISNGVRSPCSSSGQFASCQTHSGFLAGHDSDPWSNLNSAFVSRSGGGEASTSSPTGSMSKCVSVLTNEEQQKREGGFPQSKRDAKSSHVSKRRARTGDTRRPRPRDRQMIQDRVKELRELVPNGAKCSIDALLDRTIKHMLFLQGVTKRAEKLRTSAHPKVVHKRGVNSFGTHNNRGDATWAFELGGQPGICPINVENLDHPGHILVEMLCEEHGLFLEIAQVIRHLELTILRGVMESRSNKKWAHFVVEASRGFRRMDIFLPLMKLLQRNSNPIPTKF